MADDPEVIEGHVVEEVSNLPAIRQANAIVAREELTVDDLVAQADKIKQVMDRAMKSGVHYGTIPGISKPTLLKPGAETLNVLLRLAPSYHSERVFHDDGHLTVISKCTLTHIPSGLVIAEGEGLCSTREAKYAYRQGKRTCPKCGADAIVRSPRKSAYFCISNEGGCGERYAFNSEHAKVLDGQDVGRADNPDLPDTWNTVLKMADKRALVAAVLNGTAASDVFTQDVEDSATAAVASDDVVPGGDAVSGEPATPPPFDPGVAILPNAISGKDFLNRLADALNAIDTSIDWREILDVQLGRTDWEGEGKAKREEFWRRVSNAVAKLDEKFPVGSMPPPEDDDIVEAFAWAFEGTVIEIVRKGEEEAAQEAAEAADRDSAPLGDGSLIPDVDGDDIPFGEPADAVAE